MKTDLVFVAENPVEWRTQIRLTGNEPPKCIIERDDNEIAPYYTDVNYPVVGYARDELNALIELKPEPGHWYACMRGLDGSVSFIKLGDSNFVKNVLKTETNQLVNLFRNFFVSIGAYGWVDIEDDESMRFSEKMSAQANLSGKQDEAGGSVGGKVEHGKIVNSYGKESTHGVFPPCNPNFDEARRLLKNYKVLDDEFGGILKALEGGVKSAGKGILAKECKIDYSENIEQTCNYAFEVAFKYKGIDAGLHAAYSKELKLAKEKKQSICYEVRFSLE